MAHFPGFKKFITIMIANNSDREHFTVRYAQTTFDIIISLDTHPYQLLIGAKGYNNWASVMDISDDFEISMPDSDFYRLRSFLNLQSNGDKKFGSYIFLKYISDHVPSKCSKNPVQPYIMQKWYPEETDKIDPQRRTVFYRWVDQTKNDRQAHNFKKTEFYFGKKVADYCRAHNITSQWLTPEQATRLHIQTVKYPWT
jgi:hypothetical protein